MKHFLKTDKYKNNRNDKISINSISVFVKLHKPCSSCCGQTAQVFWATHPLFVVFYKQPLAFYL